jgi:hypothetical protein
VAVKTLGLALKNPYVVYMTAQRKEMYQVYRN